MRRCCDRGMCLLRGVSSFQLRPSSLNRPARQIRSVLSFRASRPWVRDHCRSAVRAVSLPTLPIIRTAPSCSFFAARSLARLGQSPPPPSFSSFRVGVFLNERNASDHVVFGTARNWKRSVLRSVSSSRCREREPFPIQDVPRGPPVGSKEAAFGTVVLTPWFLCWVATPAFGILLMTVAVASYRGVSFSDFLSGKSLRKRTQKSTKHLSKGLKRTTESFFEKSWWAWAYWGVWLAWWIVKVLRKRNRWVEEQCQVVTRTLRRLRGLEEQQEESKEPSKESEL